MGQSKATVGAPSLVLASSSPRRALLLRQLRRPFSVETPDVDERRVGGAGPRDVVRRVAAAKAETVAARHRSTATVVLAADTAVLLGDALLGKPQRPDAARKMLQELQGREHSVLTAYTVVCCTHGTSLTRMAVAEVTMRTLSQRLIDSYVETGECLDKAGGYAIQGIGAQLVSSVNGDYYAVVGLPLCDLSITLAQFGVGALAPDRPTTC